MKRLFIAMPPPDRAAEQLSAQVCGLGAGSAGLRWLAPEKLHITLVFLGAAQEGQIEFLVRATETALAGFSPFRAETGNFILLPKAALPRVFAQTVIEKSGSLTLLQARLTRKLGPCFKIDKRKFIPHITLGRFKKNPTLPAVDKPLKVAFTLSEVVLFESLLSQTGPEYRRLQTFTLR